MRRDDTGVDGKVESASDVRFHRLHYPHRRRLDQEKQMIGTDAARIAKPSIAEVLERFLADHRERLTAKTLDHYEQTIALLKDCLNGYAYQGLDKRDAALFDRLYSARGAEHREFCQIFGPEHILPNLGEFLDYFMVRKVIAGKETLRAAGTVTKKLARWLAEKGHAVAEDAADAAYRGGKAARDLPKANELAALLYEFAEGQQRGTEDDEIEDHFTLARVAPGKLWRKGMSDGRELGPIQVPGEISSRCKVGWTISGVVGRAGRRWKLVETWNVYPA